MTNFWKTLPHPFTVLAPLDGVTDVVFRQIITEIGKPDVLFTEFTMCEGLLSSGRERVMQNLEYTPDQQPIVAQIWGTKPDTFFKTAQVVKDLGFAGIDINMGCPVKDVVKIGACSALIKNPSLAGEIIQATKEGSGGLPVSVKTRIGYSKEQIDEWLGFLLEQDLAALTVHLRTAAEMSKVPAHWELMTKIVELRNSVAPKTVLIGNGDLLTLEEVKEKYETTGCEGFMIGRGVFTNPWVFNPKINLEQVTIAQRIDLYLRHIELFEKRWGDTKNPMLLRKFCKTYISNFPDASELRIILMETKTYADLKNTLTEYKESSNNNSLNMSSRARPGIQS